MSSAKVLDGVDNNEATRLRRFLEHYRTLHVLRAVLPGAIARILLPAAYRRWLALPHIEVLDLIQSRYEYFHLVFSFTRSSPSSGSRPSPFGLICRELLRFAGKRQARLHLDLCRNQHLQLYMAGYYEANELRWLCARATRAGAFIDVGAHIGLYSVSIGTAIPGLQLTSVEPVPQNAEYLRKNLALNGLGHAEVREAAVSDAPGASVFFVNPLQDGGGSLHKPDAYRTGNRAVDPEHHLEQHPEFVPQIAVSIVSLDSIIDGRPCILKIDTEGAELQVLASGENSFRARLVSSMLVEVSEDTEAAVIEFGTRHGLRCFAIESGVVRPYAPRSAKRASANLLFELA
jgi:FkbM family methyltransferase